MGFQLDKQLATDSITVGKFKLSYLLLMNDSQYPWFTLVPMKENKTEIYQLSETDQELLWQESRILSRVIMDLFGGDKLNIGAIGNLVPQLHVHHVVRFRSDACWPKPIWGQRPMVNYQPVDSARVINEVSAQLVLFGFKPSNLYKLK